MTDMKIVCQTYKKWTLDVRYLTFYSTVIISSEDMSEDSEIFESDYAKEMHKLLKSLEIWDDVDLIEPNGTWIYDSMNEKCARFLTENNIRPEFFCQYEKFLSPSLNGVIRNGRKRSTTQHTSSSRSNSKNRSTSKKNLSLIGRRLNGNKGKTSDFSHDLVSCKMMNKENFCGFYLGTVIKVYTGKLDYGLILSHLKETKCYLEQPFTIFHTNSQIQR